MATKTETYQVPCPNCGRDVDILPQSYWEGKMVKLYIPACPFCAHSFKTHIRSKLDLAEYIGYRADGIEDEIEEEAPPEKEW